MDNLLTSVDMTVAQPWQSLGRGLGFVNEHEAYWWSKLSPLMGAMMEWAKYSIPEQYRVLAFTHKYILPSCGPKPDKDGELLWKAFICYDYTPIQLSLNFHDGKMTLRTANIPISEISGTNEDPINQQASVNAVAQQQRVLPSQDLRWFNHFASKFFFDNDTAATLKTKVDELRVRQGVQCMLSHDFPPGDVQCKVAFCPLWKAVATGLSNKEIIWDAVQGLGDDIAPYEASLASLEKYTLSQNAVDTGVRPVFLAFDTVLKQNYETSRIKIYYLTARTAFSAMTNIYTLGGLLTGPDIEESLRALRVLWKAVLNIPEGWPDDQDLPVNPHRCAAVIFNFEIWPGAKLPIPKIYLPAHYYGRSDLEIADGMDVFFKSQGWDDKYNSYKKNYIKSFTNSANKLKALHHDISFSFKNAKPYVTVYYKPELHLENE